MKKMIGSLSLHGGTTFKIYYDDREKPNPYMVYSEDVYKDDKHTYPTTHRKLLHKYGNLHSCVSFIETCVANHDEEERW